MDKPVLNAKKNNFLFDNPLINIAQNKQLQKMYTHIFVIDLIL